MQWSKKFENLGENFQSSFRNINLNEISNFSFIFLSKVSELVQWTIAITFFWKKVNRTQHMLSSVIHLAGTKMQAL